LFDFIADSELNDITGNISTSSSNKQNMSVDGFIDELDKVITIQELHNICSQIRQHYGFAFFSIFSRFNRANQKPLYIIMREFNNPWTQHYIQNRYVLNDPTIRLTSVKSTPLIWNYKEHDRIVASLNPLEKKIASEGLDFGLRSIFNAPFHSKLGNFGLIRFINDRKSQHEHVECCIQRDSELFLLCSFIYQALEKIMHTKQHSNLLSQREKDILSWVANGLTPDRIANTLNISGHTVRNHLRNVRMKLQVNSMPHAVAKAVSTGLITL